ncbi:MAG: MBL fold metallo-hydrolase [Chloroflexota bacterium]|nr:MAG: MBL fold metallo-hydrolase [Chloroflexota bacterium]
MSEYKDKRVHFNEMAPEHDKECTPDVFMVSGFGNTGLVFTSEGVVVVDNTPRTAARAIEIIRARTELPIHTIIYTHGHADHAWATPIFLEDARKRGHPRPRVIGHELLAARFERYKKLGSYNRYINRIQSGLGYKPRADDRPFLPADAVYPDITFSDAMQFSLGGLTFEIYHYIGETDDGAWVWIPERKVAIAGDLVEGACPNIGNPFKLQRYELEWAEALEKIADKNPDIIIPGHGPVLHGDRAKEVCLDTARFLRHVHEEVVRLLNEGYWIEDILHMVKIPEELAQKPWLRPVYGHSTYVIHGVHRRYAGWFNGNPSDLFPARSAEIAAEVVGLCGAEELLQRVYQLQTDGHIQMALHLVDFVIKGSADSGKRKEALLLKSSLLDARAKIETNTIAKNIFLSGADAAEQEANSL